MKNIGTLKSIICKSCVNLMANPANPTPHICNSCNKKSSVLEDIAGMNYFQLFDIKVSFQVNKDSLNKEYRLLQKLVHPDLIASLNEDKATKEAEKVSSIISKSYKVLLNDYERSKYLLSLVEIDIEKEKPGLEELEEFMDLNSQIEESTSEQEFVEIGKTLEDKKQSIIAFINDSFKSKEHIFQKAIKGEKITEAELNSLKELIKEVNNLKYTLTAEEYLEQIIKQKKDKDYHQEIKECQKCLH